MTPVASLARTELLMQWRRGTVAASLGVVVLYAAILAVVPRPVADSVLPYLLFSDPAALGFFFMGGTLLSQRAEGVTAAIAVAPVTAGQVLASQVMVLGGVGTMAVIAIGVGALRPIRWELLVYTAAATAISYALAGYAVAMRSRTVNQYFARATAVSLPLFLPLAAFPFFPDSPWMAGWPTTASLALFRYSVLTGPQPSPGSVAMAAACLAAAGVAAAWWARRELVAARREGRA